MTRALRLPHAHVHAKRNIEDEMLLSPKAKMRDIIEPLLALVVQVRLDKIERQERIEALFNNLCRSWFTFAVSLSQSDKVGLE